MSRPWFRMYRSVVGSPKIQRLKPDLFKVWVNILCCTDDDGALPCLADLAFILRLSEPKTAEALTLLAKAGLVDKRDDGFYAHDWDDHQFASDADSYNAEKQRRYRERKRNALRNDDGNASGNGDHAVTTPLPPRYPLDTDTDTDTYTETEQKEERDAREQVRDASTKSRPRSSKANSTKGTRWPPDAVVPDDWLRDGAEARERHSLPPLEPALMAERFANYWASSGATKRDWKRTWINWALSEKGPKNGQYRATSLNGSGRSVFADIADELAAAEARAGAGRAPEAD